VIQKHKIGADVKEGEFGLFFGIAEFIDSYIFCHFVNMSAM